MDVNLAAVWVTGAASVEHLSQMFMGQHHGSACTEMKTLRPEIDFIRKRLEDRRGGVALRSSISRGSM